MYRKNTKLFSKHVATREVSMYAEATANYAEASEPESDADFLHKMKVALKELKESRAWLRFANELLRDEFIAQVIRETFEIQNMMGASLKKRGYNGWASS